MADAKFEIGDVVETKGGNVGIFAGISPKNGKAMVKVVWCTSEGTRFIHNKAELKNLKLADNISCVGCLFNKYLNWYDYMYGETDEIKEKARKTGEPISDFTKIDITKLGMGLPKVAKNFRDRHPSYFTADGKFKKDLIKPDKKK